MLEVVEEEQHWRPQRILQILLHGLEQRLTSSFPDSDCLSDLGNDQARITNRRERDKIHASWKVIGNLLRNLQPQTRFAGSSRTRDSNQKYVRFEQEVFDGCHFLVPSH